jgi:transposase
MHTWKKLYREKGEAAFKAPTHSHARSEPLSAEEQELLALRNKVAELERYCGQMALENSILPARVLFE